jgi:hypothetical protein
MINTIRINSLVANTLVANILVANTLVINTLVDMVAAVYLTHVAVAVVDVDRTVLSGVARLTLAGVVRTVVHAFGTMLARIPLFAAVLDLAFAVFSCGTDTS